MAADNWAICPACYKKAKTELNLKKQRLVNAYGKVTEENYLKLKAIIDKGIDRESFRTLREDYEIDTDDTGIFSVNYSCYCDLCKFSYKFNYDEDILENKK